mmetsp:Transcript_22898/g.49527  ORF Transcript_22898/g.49527 Transcript_22898/m.49527 type:complete len:116 (-) Transcript_22898:592-939(-)
MPSLSCVLAILLIKCKLHSAVKTMPFDFSVEFPPQSLLQHPYSHDQTFHAWQHSLAELHLLILLPIRIHRPPHYSFFRPFLTALRVISSSRRRLGGRLRLPRSVPLFKALLVLRW